MPLRGTVRALRKRKLQRVDKAIGLTVKVNSIYHYSSSAQHGRLDRSISQDSSRTNLQYPNEGKPKGSQHELMGIYGGEG